MKIRNVALNRGLLIAAFICILAGAGLARDRMNAVGTGEWIGIPGGNLQPKGLGAAGIAKLHGDEAAMDYIKECNALHPGSISTEEIETILDQGYLTGYVDELKALGYISSGYSVSTPAQTEGAVSEPEAFTVEDMEDTPMWATQIVNYRDGASTDYNKIGSLEQYEQVIINGVASTGWYRFNTADGATAYVSNAYLTAEDPSNRELNIYNEETGQVDTFTFEDEDPEAIDEVIEEIKEEYAEKEPVAQEPTPEREEVFEAESVVEEPVAEPVEEAMAHSWQFYVSIVFAVVVLIVIIICICYVYRNKKRGRVD